MIQNDSKYFKKFRIILRIQIISINSIKIRNVKNVKKYKKGIEYINP